MDTPKPRSMPCCHITVQRPHRVRPRHLPVLLVHIVRARPRVVTNPDTEILDLQRSLLVDHVERDDLAVGLLDLAELHKEVPEAGFGDHGVGCEDAHAVEFGGGVGVGGEVAANDLVFVEAT
jgi:hypothetical protein